MVVGIAADPRDIVGDLELRLALGQDLLGPLAFRDVSRQALDAQELPCDVKLSLCDLLQPNLAAVQAMKAKIVGERGIVGADLAHARFEARTIVGVDAPEKFAASCPDQLNVLVTENETGAIAAS